jgi:DNA-binding transcriptional MerR regulator
VGLHHMQIGEVSTRTGLSLRTIRYYEEVGLVVPTARTTGGFRLYTEADVARLHLVKRMKPLDFSLEEMKDVLSVLDQLDAGDPRSVEHHTLVGRLEMYHAATNARVSALREQLEVAETFATDLRREISRQKKKATSPKQ